MKYTRVKSMETDEQKIEALKAYFTQRDDVVMAFLFGSRAKGKGSIHNASDWDVAVYFRPVSNQLEWEETGREYPHEDEIWRDIMDILETDSVDLLILNRAPSSIAETALQGKALAMKDLSLYLRLMRVLSSVAEEYQHFVDDYYAISQRSHSLTMRDREDLIRTIVF